MVDGEDLDIYIPNSTTRTIEQFKKICNDNDMCGGFSFRSKDNVYFKSLNNNDIKNFSTCSDLSSDNDFNWNTYIKK